MFVTISNVLRNSVGERLHGANDTVGAKKPRRMHTHKHIHTHADPYVHWYLQQAHSFHEYPAAHSSAFLSTHAPSAVALALLLRNYEEVARDSECPGLSHFCDTPWIQTRVLTLLLQ